MKNLFALAAIFMTLTPFAFAQEKIEGDAMFNLLVRPRSDLAKSDCHRRVLTARAPQTMIAMGCHLESLLIQDLESRVSFRGAFLCPSGIEKNFTSYCLRK